MRDDAETLTSFLREPKRVIKRLEKGDVLLRRRRASALRLSLESRTSSTRTSGEVAAHLLADAFTALPGAREQIVSLIEHRYSWVRFLPNSAREAFVKEFVQTLEASASLGATAPIDELLAAWKSTAAIYADPALAADLKRPLPGTDISVPRPSKSRRRRRAKVS